MNSPILALDIGMKRTGVALSESGLVAQPLSVLEWQPPHSQNLVRDILSLVKKYEVRSLLVGLPLNEDDSPTQQSGKTEHIIRQIEEATAEAGVDLEIIRVNEYHSSLDGTDLHPDLDKDSAAALLLLQEYLEEHAQW